MTRAFLNVVAKLSIALLLFAIASLPCTQAAHGEETSMQADGTAVLDPAAPNLCLQHCQQGSQGTDSFASAMLPALALPLIAIVPMAITPPKLPAILQPEVLARTTAPPPSLLFCVLRA